MSRTSMLVCALAVAFSTPAFADDAAPAADPTAALRAALVQQRTTNLARFHKYRKAGIYPHNTYQAGMVNVWKDNDGHLCAVATLIEKAGRDDLVEATAKESNFVRIADLTSGPVMDWVLTSGLTQEEIVMIQQPTEEQVEAEEWERKMEKRKLARAQRREDNRLESNYVTVEQTLKTPRVADAGLDVAVARLAKRPDLAAALLASGK
jgi:hypothetical protein